MSPGDRLTLHIERPAAGGRMIARHDGGIVLAAACIPGETVEAVVEKVQRGTAWARTTRVLNASTDRVESGVDGTCGGSVFAHIRYERQLALKQEIVRDGFTRIGRMPAPDDLPIASSPTVGYRMRARLHLRRGRLGFFREGTHALCRPESTGQLLPSTLDALTALERALAAARSDETSEVEVSENCAAAERALHLQLPPEGNLSRLSTLPAIAGVTGVSTGIRGNPRTIVVSGSPFVHDTLSVPSSSGPLVVSLARHAHSFFQGNRYLVADLAAAVDAVVLPGRVLDLYAGVGLFALTIAARGDSHVCAIEGDPRSARDLATNAAALGTRLTTRHQAVETFLAVEKPAGLTTVILDPPRTGLSREALGGTIALAPPRVVYVSCDVATLARDARWLVDAGFRLTSLRAFDLFPNTAHVESVAVFDR